MYVERMFLFPIDVHTSTCSYMYSTYIHMIFLYLYNVLPVRTSSYHMKSIIEP